MKKSLKNAVDFSIFCERHGADPMMVAHMMQAVDKRAAAWIRANNHNQDTDKIQDMHQAIADSIAAELGWSLNWGVGLYPTIDGPGIVGTEMLPEVHR